MKLPFNLICIDIETTDTDSTLGSIIQIGAVIVDEKFKPIQGKEFDVFVKPLDGYRNLKAMAINGITEEEMEHGLPLDIALAKFEEFCGENKILGAWGAYFDVPFLREQYKKIHREWPFHYRSFDLKTVAIWETAKRGSTPSGGVSKFLKVLGLKFEGQKHNALADIKNSIRIINKLLLKN